MLNTSPFDELAKGANRYSAHAYEFVMDALRYVIERNGERRHVSGQELLYGARDLALDSWGLMARHVLHAWGVTSTDDIGEIVFTLVAAGVLAKTDSDKPEDFHGVFSFDETLGGATEPELDENGRVRRRYQTDPPNDLTWLSLLGPAEMN